MSGICDRCKRKPCPAAGEGLMYCDFYDGGESNYEKLFGTPERTARTLYYDKQPICAGCALLDECDKMPDEERDTCLLVGYDDLLEWLRGDAE